MRSVSQAKSTTTPKQHTTILALRLTPTRCSISMHTLPILGQLTQCTSTHPPPDLASSIHAHALAINGLSGSFPSSRISMRSSLIVISFRPYVSPLDVHLHIPRTDLSTERVGRRCTVDWIGVVGLQEGFTDADDVGDP
jgi:hypothetical protein